MSLDGSPVQTGILSEMTTALRHRGPDDEGYALLQNDSVMKHFCGPETMLPLKNSYPPLYGSSTQSVLGFGFRRLSIIDLSAAAHQPMTDRESGNTIVFNGEIYNYLELRNELKDAGCSFITNSDTEVILKAYDRWGIDCLQKFNGMWAFALYDAKKKEVFCSRDRFGVKPFYYSLYKGKFYFASELKSVLKAIPAVPDEASIANYFIGGVSDHTERTYFKSISQLRGSHYLIIRNGEIRVTRYYSLPVSTSLYHEGDALEQFRTVFMDSVKVRQRSDVPFGYALSGGLDSSAIVCAAREVNAAGSNITFSMVHPGSNVDESSYVNAVVKKTGFECRVTTPAADHFVNDLNQFVYCQEEPFGGISYYGEYKLRELIRKSGVTVSLEGQGADEIITGYNTLLPYYYFDLINDKRFLKLGKDIKTFKNLMPASIFSVFKLYLSQRSNSNSKTDSKNFQAKYPWIDSEFLFRQYHDSTLQIPMSGSYLNDRLQQIFLYESLPEQLVRADKNAMAFSVECRFPFLDYRLVELAYSMKYDLKIRNGRTKYILRESMKPFLPQEVYNRSDKIGFAVPYNNWINKNLSDTVLQIIKSSNVPDYINTGKFLSDYFDDRGNLIQPDWKFWKIFSLIHWYTLLIK